MTRYRWDRALHRALCSLLEPLGFRKVAPLCFVRKTPNCGQVLNFSGRTRSGRFMFTCTVGIRFMEIESRLRPDNKDESYPTVFTPFHFLYESRRYFEWEVRGTDELETIASDAISEIMMVATPFFERFSNLDSVEKELKRDGVTCQLPLSAHQRTEVLAAIALHNGHCDEAKGILCEAMSAPENNDVGSRRWIEELAKRLFPDP